MNENEKRKAVAYKVNGFPSEQIAGPYTQAEAALQLTDIAGFEGVYDARVIDVTIHLLANGAAICGFPGVPARWPGHHVWVSTSEIEDATCQRCLADHKALHP